MSNYLRLTYWLVILILLGSTIAALLHGGYQIAGGIMAGIAFGSFVASLVPYFIAMYFFRRFKKDPLAHPHSKWMAWLFYTCCFPVKLWVIYSNIDLFIHGGYHWNFG